MKSITEGMRHRKRIVMYAIKLQLQVKLKSNSVQCLLLCYAADEWKFSALLPPKIFLG